MDTWPALRYDDWTPTRDTLHLWTQVIGKVRLKLTPLVNHWWNVPLYVTTRGLTTSPMPMGERTLEIVFDFHDHDIQFTTSDGRIQSWPLKAYTVADFYDRTMRTLQDLDCPVAISTKPNELLDATRFPDDHRARSYDRDAVRRFIDMLVQADRVLQAFRSEFVGKCSPVHFFWGSFDLAVTRFSGRPAPPHPGGIPNLPDYVTREAYSHEVSSAGFWPGGPQLTAPVFYSYAYPEPAGFSAAMVKPSDAEYHSTLHEFVLPYDAVRMAPHRDEALLSFLRTSYEAAATLARWDRESLERPHGAAERLGVAPAPS